MIGEFRTETPKNIRNEEFICLRSKIYAFKCGNDRKNKLKGICKSQSKNIKFEEYKNCLHGSDYQKDCDNYIIPSIIHEMNIQLVQKSTIPPFDDKRCYESNIKSKPWN